MDKHILTFFFIAAFVKDVLCQQVSNENLDENICSKHPSNVIVANPYDCHSFYACQHGNAMKIICPYDSIFNQKLGNCDPNYSICVMEEENTILTTMTDKKELLSENMAYEDDETNSDNTTNNAGTINSSTPPTNIDNTTTINTLSPTEGPDNCTSAMPISPHTNDIQCPPNDTEQPSFLPSDSFCDSFYLCYHGRPFEMFCSIGFYWNQERKECILERESNCTDSSVGNKVPKCPAYGQHFFPHSERCHYFYYCENGVRSIQQCTAFKHWDILEQTCKMDRNARCITTIPRSQRAKYYTL